MVSLCPTRYRSAAERAAAAPQVHERSNFAMILITSTLITLVLLPVIYEWMATCKERKD